MTTTALVKVNERYIGRFCVAITKYNQMYGIICSSNEQELSGHFKESESVLGSNFRRIQTYKGINGFGVSKLQEAASELEAGKKIDLERILG